MIEELEELNDIDKSVHIFNEMLHIYEQTDSLTKPIIYCKLFYYTKSELHKLKRVEEWEKFNEDVVTTTKALRMYIDYIRPIILSKPKKGFKLFLSRIGFNRF